MKVLIAAGGSGGHIFPAVALADELYKNNKAPIVEVIFVASGRDLDRKILQNTPYKKIYLPANPMPYQFDFQLITFLIKLIAECFHVLLILIRHAPDIVVGFGGYTAGVIVFLAAIMNIKTIIHEQNRVPGRANRFLDGFVDEVAVSFIETKKYFKNKNVGFTGNPLRKESLRECRIYAIDKFRLNKNKFTILVMGGSQGASSLNDLVLSSLSLLPYEKRESLQFIYITGPRDFDRFKNFCRRNGMDARVFEFVENINEAYSVCDLAISRSGAAAIFELAAFGKPMILIPYPSQRNNQRFNAIFFAEKKAAVCWDEMGASAEKLKDLIMELLDNPDKRKALSENAKRLSVIDGAERLKEEIKKL